MRKALSRAFYYPLLEATSSSSLLLSPVSRILFSSTSLLDPAPTSKSQRSPFSRVAHGSASTSDFHFFESAHHPWAKMKANPKFNARIVEPSTAIDVQDLRSILPFCYELGELRQRSLSSRGITGRCSSSSPASLANHSSDLAPKPPAHSFLELVYPFSQNKSLRDTYRRFKNDELRLGLMLEDLDCFAADVAYRHCNYDPLCALVTASVDKISWFAKLSLAQDFKLCGQVSWTGSSSIEVKVEAAARSPGQTGSPWVHVGQARFIMVARSHPDLTKARTVPPLQPSTPLEKELFVEGEQARERRRKREQVTLKRHPPTAHEMKLLHTMLTSGVRPGDGVHVSMASTERSSLQIMHSQDRNNHDRIFGGMLMKEAFELATATAATFSGSLDAVSPISIDDISFYAPVEIGTLLSFKAEVVYVEGPFMRVLVVAESLNPERISHADKKVTNEFLVTFLAKPGVQLKRVLPLTLAEGLRYLDGLRRHVEEREEVNGDTSMAPAGPRSRL